MKATRRFFIIGSLLLFFHFSWGNTSSDTLINHDLLLTLDKTQIKRLEKATELLQKNEQALYNYMGHVTLTEDQLKELDKVIEEYQEGIGIAKEVYAEMIKKFYSEIGKNYIEELGRPDHLMNRARKYFRAADRKAELAGDSIADDNYLKATKLYRTSFTYKYNGIVNLARTVRVFQDWPAEYPYEWDDYEKPKGPDGVRVYFADRDSIEDLPPADTITNKDVPPVNYKVQIAAHTVPMDEAYLKTIYAGNMNIDLIMEDNWYKYSIGNFSTFEEAVTLLNNIKVEKAFIVAYQSGKKINLKKALEITKR